MDSVIPYKEVAAQAIALGASLVGVTYVATLLDSPSHRLRPVKRHVRDARSVVVLALAHIEGQPEMDWWDNQEGRTPGNRLLMEISQRLTKWLREAYSTEAYELPYHAIHRGVFLKDAAILAGLGVMGKNNLLITPQYGPRVRLRALLLNRPLEGAELPDDFAPCDGCEGPCMQACPWEALHGGGYERERCLQQMNEDETDRIVLAPPFIGMPAKTIIAYCRLCELSCPVGQ
jgi:epoxyqueuosine reductase